MNNAETNIAKQIIVKIKVLDHTGHTNLEQCIEEAINTAFDLHLANGKQINVRAEDGLRPFELHADGPKDTVGLLKDAIRLHEQLSKYENPVIYITGALAGGFSA